MQTPDELIVKARPFFLNYYSKLAKDLNTLTAAQVSCSLGEIKLMRGGDDIDTLFEADRSVAYVREDGTQSGDLHIIFDVTTSIALTGLMMMMGESVIKDQVKNRAYNDEINEGFHEVANQIVGSMNELVDRKIKSGGHLLLEGTQHVQYGERPNSLDEAMIYLSAIVDVKVGNFPMESARWLLSQGFAEALLDLKIADPDAEGGLGDMIATGPALSKKTRDGVDLATYATVGVDPVTGNKIDLSQYANAGIDPATGERRRGPADLTGYEGPLGDEDEGGPADLSAYASDDDEKPKERTFSTSDGLPLPNEPGGVKVVMTEPPFALKEEERVIKAINAMRQDGYRFIGVDSKGKLSRVVTQSDLRQLMGPFFGTKAMSARDKAICTVELSKVNKEQQLIRIPIEGTIQQAADLLIEFDLRALPVVSKQGVLRGFVTVHAVLDYYRKKR